MKNMISMPLKSMPGSNADRNRNRGFTLIELLVTLAVSSIVMAAIYSVYAGLTRSYTTQNAAADLQQAVRATIDVMAEDIMLAGLGDRYLAGLGKVSYDEPCPIDKDPKDAEISAAGSKIITIRSDRNMDGDVCDDYEDITYEYDDVSGELRQTDNNKPLGTDNPEVFIDNVVQFEFKYYTENDDDTPTDNDIVNGDDLFSDKYKYNDPMDESERQDIRTVEISLEVEEPAGRGGMIPREYTTRVRCRNAGL